VKIAREDLHILTGGYALDALAGPEREDFERHLPHCPSCEAEVRGLRETAARLAMAKTVKPPPRMQAHVLTATYQTRQLPPQAGDWPVLPQFDSGKFGFGQSGSGRRSAGQSGSGRRSAGQSGSGRRRAGRRETMRLGPERPRVRVSGLITAAAAASVAAAVGLGITQIATQHQLQSAQASNAAITQVVQAPDAHIESKRTGAGGTVTVVFSGQQRAAVVSTKGMKSLPSGQVYQLWVMSPAGAGPASARSAGLLTQPDQPNDVLASQVRPGDRIGITVEPSGGTSSPTATPVLVLPLTA
jgi:anti-sigma-K factor RskA